MALAADTERETPELAGKRLQEQLDALFPSLQVRCFDSVNFVNVDAADLHIARNQPLPHPRAYPVNREELEELCGDDAERSRLQKVCVLFLLPCIGMQCSVGPAAALVCAQPVHGH